MKEQDFLQDHNPLYFAGSFFNFEEYRSMASRWNIDFKKINKGTFQGGLAILDMGVVQFGRTNLSGTVLQAGQTPIGFRSFVLPVHTNQEFKWFNQSINSHKLLVFPKNNEISAVTLYNFDVYIISIKEEHLQRLIDKFGYTNLSKTLKSDEQVFVINKYFHHYINSYIAILLQKVERLPATLYSRTFHHSITENLPRMILDHLDRKDLNPESLKKLKKNDYKINAVIEYIHKYYSNRILVSHLCEKFDISERSLEYGFKERFLMGPARYIKSLKLHQIRNELIHKPLPIKTVAENYGFNHLGQFSVDYKDFFGELPSETLSKMRNK